MMSRTDDIIAALHLQTVELLEDPVKLREYVRRLHGPPIRAYSGTEAEQMITILKLIGHYLVTDNQRTCTYFYIHNEREYRITYGLGDDPLVEEVLPYE